MIQLLLTEDQEDEASIYPLRDEVRQVYVHDVVYNSTPDNDYKVTAVILSVKAPREDTRGLEFTGNYHKPVNTYHRLILCRELSLGDLFYFLTATPAETAKLFAFKDAGAYIGAYVVVFQPICRGQYIFGVPQFVSDDPFVPVIPNVYEYATTPMPVGGINRKSILSFHLEVDDLHICCANIVPSCGCVFCDGRHTPSVKCPGLKDSVALDHKKALSVLVSTDSGRLKKVRYQSTEMASFFMDPALLRTQKVDFSNLKNSIVLTLAHYAREEVPFIITGWYKMYYLNNDPSQVIRNLKGDVHISTLRPKRPCTSPPPLFTVDRKDPALLKAEPAVAVERQAGGQLDDAMM